MNALILSDAQIKHIHFQEYQNILFIHKEHSQKINGKGG